MAQETDIFPKDGMLNVLVIDDDESIASLVRSVVESLDHRCDVAHSGEAGLFKISGAESPYDVLFLDINLPGMDGFEVCAKLRERAERKPVFPTAEYLWIIGMTSLRGPQDIESMLRAGANDYIVKPLDPETIYVKTLVSRYASARNRGLKLRIKNLEKSFMEQRKVAPEGT
jgi:two-component system, OmpR family, response regulator